MPSLADLGGLHQDLRKSHAEAVHRKVRQKGASVRSKKAYLNGILGGLEKTERKRGEGPRVCSRRQTKKGGKEKGYLAHPAKRFSRRNPGKKVLQKTAWQTQGAQRNKNHHFHVKSKKRQPITRAKGRRVLG